MAEQTQRRSNRLRHQTIFYGVNDQALDERERMDEEIRSTEAEIFNLERSIQQLVLGSEQSMGQGSTRPENSTGTDHGYHDRRHEECSRPEDDTTGVRDRFQDGEDFQQRPRGEDFWLHHSDAEEFRQRSNGFEGARRDHPYGSQWSPYDVHDNAHRYHSENLRQNPTFRGGDLNAYVSESGARGSDGHHLDSRPWNHYDTHDAHGYRSRDLGQTPFRGSDVNAYVSERSGARGSDGCHLNSRQWNHDDGHGYHSGDLGQPPCRGSDVNVYVSERSGARGSDGRYLRDMSRCHPPPGFGYGNDDVHTSQWSGLQDESFQRDPSSVRPWHENLRAGPYVGRSDSYRDDGLARQSRLLYLASINPVQFRGESRDFPGFEKRVVAALDRTVLSDTECLEFLPRFLDGPALKKLENLRGRSFQAVMRAFKDAYGHPTKVVNSFMFELTEGPPMKANERKKLQDFADLLESAAETLCGEYFKEASCSPHLVKIVNRLPSSLKNDWEKKIIDIVGHRSAPNLSDLSRFVSKHAQAKNNPFYQNAEKDGVGLKSGGSARTGTNGRIVSLVTDIPAPAPAGNGNVCRICRETGHYAQNCTKFRSLTPEDRYLAVTNGGLCYVCLRSSCRSVSCPRKDQNFVCRCWKPHNKLLPCRTKPDELSPSERKDKVEQKLDTVVTGVSDHDEVSEEGVVCGAICGKGGFLMSVVPIRLHGPAGELTTYAFLDSGSKATFVDQDVAKRLNIVGPEMKKTLSTVTDTQEQVMQQVGFEMSNIVTGHRIKVQDFAFVMKDVNLSSQLEQRPFSVVVDKFEHLRKLDFPDVELPVISVLIGLPVFEAHKVVKYYRGKDSEPYGIETRLGIAVAGPVAAVTTNASGIKETLGCKVSRVVEACPPVEDLVGAMDRFCCASDYGVEFPWLMGLSASEQQAMNQFNNSIRQRDDGFYECRLLWKNEDCKLPCNRDQVMKRFKSLERRFEADPKYAAMYKEAMDSTVQNGWASEIPDSDVPKIDSRTFYLSHFGVSNVNKPGKVRPVFDLAERHDGVSLNDCLLTGPDGTSSLVGVLMRARTGRVAVSADVRSMFNMCMVAPEDRDSLRFLWYDGAGKIKDFRMNTHVFGAADSPFVANMILKQIAVDHGDKYGPEVVNAVKHNFYVDDVLVSASTVDEAIRLSHGMKRLLAEGSFSLVKFASNDSSVLEQLDASDLASPAGVGVEGDVLPARALGLIWEQSTDSFGVKIPVSDDRETMRGVVSQTAKLFDPLGYISPVILTARLIAQECWKRSYDWNDILEPDILEKWNNWKGQLPALVNLTVPRPYFPLLSSCSETGIQLELHVFCDASSYGTGCAVYLRAVDSHGNIHLGFVFGKARVLPLKPKLTIPRAELRAAVDAVHIGSMVREELDLNSNTKSLYWTDSEIVLKYLANFERHFHVFVANRVSEIRRFTSLDQWRFCPGKLNVSDDASRGVMPEAYGPDSRFLRGPDFLRQTETDWPHQKINAEIADGDPEVKCSSLRVCVCDLDSGGARSCSILDLAERSSSWIRVRRVIGRILRWSDAHREHRKVDSSESVSIAELERAENAVISCVQREYFSEELSQLKTQKKLSNPSIVQLNPIFNDAGLMVVGGRLRNAKDLDYMVKHPAILPSSKDCNLSAIIARECHRKLGHGGKDLVVAKLREKFWIIYVDSYVKSMISKCVLCRKRNAQPVQQIMGDLPSDRLSFYEPCFASTGTDLFGPMYCKEGRKIVKYYGIIFMCLTTMAIHIEMVKWMTTEDMIAALMNFVSLRGGVRRIRSDNGSNYVGAEKELKDLARLWNEDQIVDSMAFVDVQWKFQTPYASAQSGIWERRVRETKRHLYGLLKEKEPSPQVLRTLLYEVAAIMNQVPLCPISSDPTSYEALTPGHFLFNKPASVLCPLPTDSDSRYKMQWRQVQQLADSYWIRYMKEYVPTLQTRKKWQHHKRNLIVGDLVLVIQTDLPRCRWTMGRVIEVFRGSDENVRSARVKTKDGVYDRPIQKLGLLLENDE